MHKLYLGSPAASLIAALALLCGHVCSYDIQQFSVNIYGNESHEMSPLLYGIFFEEINNAGDGGLHAEMVRDRSFEALAADTLPMEAGMKNGYSGWEPWSGTEMVITSEHPISMSNRHAACLSTKEAVGGLSNGGYWGIPVQAGREYAVSMYIALPPSSKVHAENTTGTSPRWVRVALQSQDGKVTYASATTWASSEDWELRNATLSPLETDTDARLSVSFQGAGQLLIDAVSVFPAENAQAGSANPWPFRKDLLDKLKALRPRFVRFPGGCYVKGWPLLKDGFQWKEALGPSIHRPGPWFLRFPGGCYVEGGPLLRDRFQWKEALGPSIHRAGHWNGQWGYWSTDGLGLFEYMLLAEALEADPVWVMNAGISHLEDTPTSQIGPWIQDALDSIEFISGPADSTWGAKRADMGRTKPWNLTYLAIGNENCGHPAYIGNYLAFYFAIKAHHPHMKLIANCALGNAAPTEIFDWHMYTSADDMFARRNDFNQFVAGQGPRIFASEYAVTVGAGWGNLKAAVGEAGFMTGLERKSDVVSMAAYAPLLVNTNNRGWNPDMIVFDNHRVYGTPSYEVQKLFSEFRGVRFLRSDVDLEPVGPFHEWTLATSTTCQDADCHHLALKVVNIAPHRQNVSVFLHNITWGAPSPAARQIVIAGSAPQAENSFEDPHLVEAQKADLDLQVVARKSSSAFNVTLPGTSVVCFEIEITKGSKTTSVTVDQLQSQAAR